PQTSCAPSFAYTTLFRSSASEELAARELRVRVLVHPVVGTVRDERGRIERVLSGRDASHRESVMHYELERRLGATERADLERKIDRKSTRLNSSHQIISY